MPNDIPKEIVIRKWKLCLLANIILDSQSKFSHNIELQKLNTLWILLKIFSLYFILQIFEFPEAPKNQVQLSPNPSRKRKQLWMCAY